MNVQLRPDPARHRGTWFDMEKLARIFHIALYNPIYPVLSSVFAEELVNYPVDHFFCLPFPPLPRPLCPLTMTAP
ncbi:hypothetical protein [Aeromonas bivalvium]|uniref:hypothetical protein n=1 Tax=Aeromonas bivalvium TaxID=440079 RepID=UPI003D1D73D3